MIHSGHCDTRVGVILDRDKATAVAAVLLKFAQSETRNENGIIGKGLPL